MLDSRTCTSSLEEAAVYSALDSRVCKLGESAGFSSLDSRAYNLREAAGYSELTCRASSFRETTGCRVACLSAEPLVLERQQAVE